MLQPKLMGYLPLKITRCQKGLVWGRTDFSSNPGTFRPVANLNG